MAAVKWNLDTNAGQDWMADINLLNTDGTARDVTGHTFAASIKRHYKSVAAKETIGAAVINATQGNLRLTLTNTQTSNLKDGKWLYDVEMTKTSTGEKERVIEGILIIRPEVTT
tara:strand:+ start:2178 stop:2519 length:342 start_codon:yes stop_codon:yes gene_type:complete